MMHRRSCLQAAVVAPWLFRAQELYAQAARASAPLKIKDVKVIATSPARQHWVLINVLTSEDGLYGLGSANCAYLSWAVEAALEKHRVPFWIGKEVDRIEDLWQSNAVRSYWRNGPVTNVV